MSNDILLINKINLLSSIIMDKDGTMGNYCSMGLVNILKLGKKKLIIGMVFQFYYEDIFRISCFSSIVADSGGNSYMVLHWVRK